MRKKKFTRGQQIVSVSYAVDVIMSGNYVYFRHKPIHPAWMQSMQLGTVARLVRQGHLYQALRNEE